MLVGGFVVEGAAEQAEGDRRPGRKGEVRWAAGASRLSGHGGAGMKKVAPAPRGRSGMQGPMVAGTRRRPDQGRVRRW